MRKYNLRDAFAYNFAKLLPHNEPNLWRMDDADRISLLSWCEDWEPQKVYETAYKESRIEELLSWDEWADNIQPLPTVVRTELERAILIHEKYGNLRVLLGYSFFQTWVGRISKWGFWIFAAIVLISWFG